MTDFEQKYVTYLNKSYWEPKIIKFNNQKTVRFFTWLF